MKINYNNLNGGTCCPKPTALSWVLKSLLLVFVFAMSGAPLFSQKECNATFSLPEALEHEKQIAKDLAQFTQEFIKNDQANDKMPAIDIPFRIHIVQQDNGTGGADYGDILAEMAIVNARYAPDLTFTECGSVHYINSSDFYDLSGDAEGDLMSATHNSADVLNIYFVGNADGACGWARFTFLLPSDYIVIDNACATNTSTLAHEVGHYFDLFHTHETAFGAECVDGSNCGAAGDLLCDTPADPDVSGNVNGACMYTGADLDPCNNDSYTPDATNIMSYSNKTCRTFFSVDQRARVVFTAMNARSYLAFNCAPDNDDCINAEPIDCGQTLFGNTTNATFDNVSFCGTSNGSSGVWFTFTGNGDPVELTTCGAGTNYDTKLRVYSGSCGALDCVGGDDDEPLCNFSGLQSRVAFTSTPGTQYFILVHGFGSSKGNFELSMNCIPCPNNDDVCNAAAIEVGGTASADLGCATAQIGEPSPGPGTGQSSCDSQDGWCSFETGVQASLWYTFVAPASGKINIETIGGDTQLALWEVGDCNDFASFTEVAANDDGGDGLASLISNACVTPGNTYYVQVDDFGGGPTFAAFDIVVTEGDALALNCPPDVGIPCGDPTDPGVTGEATGNTDDCCPNPPVITHSDVTDPNGLSITRTWTATYDCGQVLTCDQVITILPGTYNGNIAFTSQAQVDAWLACYTTINGSVIIQGAGIFNLGPLMNVQTITGNLTIQYAGVFDLNGLQGLQTVGGTVTIFYNYILSSLSGLENLSSVGASFWMYYNFLLSDCCAIDDLLTNGGVGATTTIFFNAAGSHCSSAAAIMAACPVMPLVGNPNNGTIATGEAVTLQEGKRMSLYPNPASQEVNVLFDRTSPTATLRIMDMLGRVVYETELNEGMDRVTIDLNGGQFENGLYLVTLLEDGVMTTKQLVVQQ